MLNILFQCSYLVQLFQVAHPQFPIVQVQLLKNVYLKIVPKLDKHPKFQLSSKPNPTPQPHPPQERNLHTKRDKKWEKKEKTVEGKRQKTQ